jgi:hypothetical protein
MAIWKVYPSSILAQRRLPKDFSNSFRSHTTTQCLSNFLLPHLALMRQAAQAFGLSINLAQLLGAPAGGPQKQVFVCGV